MTATTIAFANLRNVVRPGTRCPGIRPHRNLGTMWPTSQRHRVSSLRIEIVRNELVETLVPFVDKIEMHDTASVCCLAANGLKRLQMLSQYRFETTLYFFTSRDFFQ